MKPKQRPTSRPKHTTMSIFASATINRAVRHSSARSKASPLPFLPVQQALRFKRLHRSILNFDIPDNSQSLSATRPEHGFDGSPIMDGA